MNINGKDYPNSKEFARELGVDRTTLWRYANKYPEATFKFGKFTFWDRDKFEQIFKQHRGDRL